MFTALAGTSAEPETLRARLGLHPRSARDFLDALVALVALGGILEMANARLFGFWPRAMTALSTGSISAIGERFPWSGYRTFADIGCAEGGLGVHLARRHPPRSPRTSARFPLRLCRWPGPRWASRIETACSCGRERARSRSPSRPAAAGSAPRAPTFHANRVMWPKEASIACVLSVRTVA